MKIVKIFGNGFNNQIASIIYNYPKERVPQGLNVSLDVMASNINGASRLWEKLDAFKEIKAINPYLSEELIIKILLSGLKSVSKTLNDSYLFDYSQNSIEKFLTQQFIEIADNFRRHQTLEGCKSLKKLFPYFGYRYEKLLEDSHVQKLHICTTNYDGFLDTLLTSKYRNQFICRDGFGNGILKDYKQLSLHSFKFCDRFLSHLHGSYKFQRLNNETFKVVGELKNESPVMVFNDPDLKESLIENDSVLSAYFRKLQDDLSHYDRLIIYGNSFKNEPHLKKKIKANFDRPNTDLIICSIEPEEVEKEIRPFYSQKIYLVNTKNIILESSLLSLFSTMFKRNISSEIKLKIAA